MKFTLWQAKNRGSLMTDNIENLIIEHLKRFQSTHERIERKLDEHTARLGRIEIALSSILPRYGA